MDVIIITTTTTTTTTIIINNNNNNNNIKCPVEMLQQVCLLGTARILRKVLDT